MRNINFILLLLLLFFACSPSVKSQWTKVNFSDSLYFQQFGAGYLVECNGKLFALGGGSLFVSSNGGESWSHIATADSMNAARLYSSGKILFLDTWETKFFKSTDNGSTWTNINLPFETDVKSFVSDSTQIFVGTGRGIFYSTDNGTKWIPRNNGLPDTNFTLIYSLLIDGSKLYAGTNYNGIYISANAGNDWEALNKGLPNALSSIPRVVNMVCFENTIFASISDNNVYRLLKGQDTWEKANTGIPNIGLWVPTVYYFVIKDSTLYAVTTEAIYGTNDNGNNWKIVYNGPLFNSGSLVPVYVYDSNFYMSADYGLYESTDNGNTWIPRNEGLGEIRHRYPWGVESYNSTLCVEFDDYKAYLSSDQGKSWEDFGIGFNEYTVVNDSDLNHYAGGSKFFKLSYVYFIKNDKDGTWKQIYANPSPYWITWDLILIDTTLIAACDNGIYYTGYSNESLFNRRQQSNWELSLAGIYCNTLTVNDNIIYAGTKNGIYLSTDYGKHWEQHWLKDMNVYKLFVKGSKLLVAADGDYYRSLDGGNNWSNFNIGLSNVWGITLCGDNLFALTQVNYTNGTIWKNSFNEVITNIKKEETLPIDFSLSQNYPNPFNPTTTITYSVPKTSFVTIKVYNILGRQIKTLVNDEKPAGSYKIKFDGSNYASGIYFYRMQAGDFIETKKLILLK